MAEIKTVLTDNQCAQMAFLSNFTVPDVRAIESAVLAAITPVQVEIGEIVNKYGDPEAFAEHDLQINDSAIQRLPIGTKIYAAAPSPTQQAIEAVRDVLHPMHNEDGTLTQWYLDCDGHYIDVAKDEDGKYSIYFRNREDNKEAWLDQAELGTNDAARRYEIVRKLNGHQFAELYKRNTAGEGRFDDLVDQLGAQAIEANK